jgi:hypothetical protein
MRQDRESELLGRFNRNGKHIVRHGTDMLAG